MRNLLDMRSGLLAQDNAQEPGNILLRAYLHPRHEEIIVNRYPLTHVPGSRYEYNNATAELVSPVIERATGQRYEDWVSEQVLKPIGALGGTIWLNRPGGVAHSGCCVLLPAETYLRLAILLLQDGVWEGERLLPEDYVDAMRTPTPQNPWAGMGVYVAGKYVERRGAANPEIAMGTTFHSEPYLDKDLFLFDGNNNQTVHIVPSEQLIVLRLGSRPPKEPDWDNTYLPNTLIRGIIRQPGEMAPTPQLR
jgi:CubicO group peptidase (beta-lactamase class C family)